MIDTPDERNPCSSRASVELHSRCSRSGRCHSSLVSRKSKNESMVSVVMRPFSSGTIAGRMSLDDSRQRVADVIVTGMMDAVVVRSFLLSEGAFDTIMKSISDNALLVENLAVCGDVRFL